MKKVTQLIASAFLLGNNKAAGNTMTDGQSVFLHGNKIAEKRNDGIYMTLAGWNTPTTRERLNGILREFNINSAFHQVDFEPKFDGDGISATEWVCVHKYPFAS